MRPKTDPLRRLAAGWRIQRRVIGALMIRELSTRFGRENFGFLWMMFEPLLFPALVAMVWRLLKGSEDHGISVIAFVVTGYVPLTLFRHAVGRSLGVITANGGLMYHRQISLLDFIFVRFLIEMIGAMMAFVLIASVLIYFGVFPVPADPGLMIGGWLIYSLITLSICLVLAPLSEVSSLLEKLIPVTTYVMIPFAGTFNLVSWLDPSLRNAMMWSPFVDAMEMIRSGVFGNRIHAYYNVWIPLAESMVCFMIGLVLCRVIRRKLVVE